VHALLHSALKENATASKLILDRHDGKDARSDHGQKETCWESKTPAERARLSREAVKRIDELYGLSNMDEKESSTKNPEPGKEIQNRDT